jgi:hypothetical protein
MTDIKIKLTTLVNENNMKQKEQPSLNKEPTEDPSNENTNKARTNKIDNNRIDPKC